jgi:chromosome segregation ATPase
VNINIPYEFGCRAEVRHLHDVPHDYRAKFHLADSRRLEVEKELRNMRVKIRALGKEVKGNKQIAKQQAASIQNLKQENRLLAAYPAKVQMLEAEVAKLRAATIEVSTKSEQANTLLEAQKLELNAQVKTLEGESTALRQDYALSNLNLRRMTEEMEKVSELNERLKEKARGSVANNLLKSENKRLEQGVSRMKEQATQAMEKLRQSEKKFENTKVDLETKGRDLRRLEREITSQTAENRNLTHANLALRAELDNLEESNRNILEENLGLREDLAREILVLDQIRDKIAGKVEEGILPSTNHSEHLRKSGEVIQVGLDSGSRMDPERPLKSEEKLEKNPNFVKEESS